MPYDERLVLRIRALIPRNSDFSEKKMFGGLAFLFKGNMCITVSGRGGILARVGPGPYEALCTEVGVEAAVMRGKKMNGWLRVSAGQLQTKEQLQRWLTYCLSFAESLPARNHQRN